MGQAITSCGHVIGKGSHYFKNLLIVQIKLLPVTTCFQEFKFTRLNTHFHQQTQWKGLWKWQIKVTKRPTRVLLALMSLAEICVIESELFHITAESPTMYKHMCKRFVVSFILPQRIKARTMQHTWWTVVLQSYDITWPFLQAIQHIAQQLMEILSSNTLEREVMTVDCWQWKHRDCSFFCPGKFLKCWPHFHAVNV